jgi:hypothetical protein
MITLNTQTAAMTMEAEFRASIGWIEGVILAMDNAVSAASPTPFWAEGREGASRVVVKGAPHDMMFIIGEVAATGFDCLVYAKRIEPNV